MAEERVADAPSLSLLCFQLLKRKMFFRAARNRVPWLSSKHSVSRLLAGSTPDLFACPYVLYLLPSFMRSRMRDSHAVDWYKWSICVAVSCTRSCLIAN